jgi:nitrogen regulatory protein P-II 1
MKSITVIIPPTRLADIKEAVWEMGIEFMTISNVMVCEPKFSRSDANQIPSCDEDYLNKTKIEIMVSDDLVDSVIDAIRRTRKKDLPGDGTVIVTDIPALVDISKDASFKKQ